MSQHPPFYRAKRNGRNSSEPPAPPREEIQFQLLEEHARARNDTAKHIVGAIGDYRSREMKFIKFLKDHYSEGEGNLYDALVFKLTPEDLADETRHYHSATHGLRYNKIPATAMQAFISGGLEYKNKEKKTVYKYDHKRKMNDAILYCSQFAKEGNGPVTNEYRDEMKAYLDTVKKQSATQKSDGKTEERDADPWHLPLVKLICRWAVETGNIFVWAFLLLQWNIMGRSCNVDAIGLHNFTAEKDSVVFCLDKNKKDQKGENVSKKHCYDNPLKPKISLFLALGVYLCLHQSKFKKKDGSDKLFRAEGKDGSSSNTYCKSLRAMLAKKWEVVYSHVRRGHFNPHGTRKGSATHVTTCTMDPPPIPSVMMRGEWSMGKVLEVYWRFSALGDTYLGRCLAGMSPDKPLFGILPPHFTVNSDNKYVKEGMRACFGVILDNFGHCGVEGALLLFLASIVYHSKKGGFLMQTIANHPNHPFLNIPILSNTALLEKLQELVTTEPTPDIMEEPTGVPQTVKMQDKLREFSTELRAFREEFENFKSSLPDLMKKAVDEKIKEAGNVSPDMVLEKIGEVTQELTTKLTEKMDQRFEEMAKLVQTPASHHLDEAVMGQGEDGYQIGRPGAQLYRSYKYEDPNAAMTKRHLTDWAVPETFAFPTPTPFLDQAWKAWLVGYPHLLHQNGSTIIDTPVRPLRLLKHGRLPSKVKKRYDNIIRPIMELMDAEVHDEIKNKPVIEIDTAFLDSTFTRAMTGISRMYPDFEVEKAKTWRVATCSKKIKVSNAINNKNKKRTADEAFANSNINRVI